MPRHQGKYAVAAILALWSVTAQADDDLPPASIPNIPAFAISPQAFVPAGWKLEHVTRGDLNNDRLNDIALVIRSDNPKLVIANPNGLGRDTFDSNPRTIIIALAARGEGYRRVGTNHVLIPRIDDPVIDDPFEDQSLGIEKGLLKLTIGYWRSAGGWTMNHTSFTFRYRDGAARLIGYDKDEIDRGSGEETKTSVNYLTGKMSVGVGSIEHDRVKTQWIRLGRKPLIRFDDMEHGWEFDPSQGYVAPGE